jgi:phosphoglycerate kinase
MRKMTVRDVKVEGKRVLVRVDFNVPIQGGDITDDTRVRAALPTIEDLLGRGAAVILCSHLGRPKGVPYPALSLKPVAEYLATLIPNEVKFASDCVGREVDDAVETLQAGEILVLENTRFHREEKENDSAFAGALASHADLFVNDAFGSAHRAHASTEGVTHFLPAVAGYLMEKELRYLTPVLESPAHPFVAILGGAKISDKIGVVESLLTRADKLLIGGAMANTFLAAEGLDLAQSLVEAEAFDDARRIRSEAGGKLVLPEDLVATAEFADGAERRDVPVDRVPHGWRAVDIGAQTSQRFADEIRPAQLVVWNGPMGVFELPSFAKGTYTVGEAVADCRGTTIVGGGDSVAAVTAAGLAHRIDHVSTGGGAMLTFLEGKPLPGIEALLEEDDDIGRASAPMPSF